MALVIDTGVLVAALDEGDSDHARCADLIENATEQLVIPAPVLDELDYWIRKFADVRVWLTFCEDVSQGAYSLFALNSNLVGAAANLQVRFADQPLGFVDAAVAITCEALGENKVATLDRRHFGVVRIRGNEPLHIVPT